ncbi:MAG: molybdate ABC transporter substrate-binding protein [Gemmataceae bacterium]
MMRWVVLGSAVLLAGAAWVGWKLLPSRGDRPEAEVRVAAAADLKFALEELADFFQEAYPHIRVTVTVGASGNLYAQLMNRAPFDLYLSADVDYPRKLGEAGLADPDSLFVYAIGHLALVVPRSSPIDLEKRGAQALTGPGVRKIAIANPRFAPYGQAAVQALESLGIHAQVKDRLVLGENVAQAAHFLHSGAVDAAALPVSLASVSPLREEARFWRVPEDAYPRLNQGGIILSWAQNREATQALAAYLQAPAGQAVLKRHGFGLPGE